MPVPVMRIRKMRVGVRQRRMLVRVLVGCPWGHWLGMRVGVVHIATLAVAIGVAVLMVMEHRIVCVDVAVPFGQMQANADGHQQATDQQRQRD